MSPPEGARGQGTARDGAAGDGDGGAWPGPWRRCLASQVGVWSSLLTSGSASDPDRYRSSWAVFLRDLCETSASRPPACLPETRRPARMRYLVPRSQSPSQAPSTPPWSARGPSLPLPHPHLPSGSPGPQVRRTAEFHAPQRPPSSGEGKRRCGPVPLPS